MNFGTQKISNAYYCRFGDWKRLTKIAFVYYETRGIIELNYSMYRNFKIVQMFFLTFTEVHTEMLDFEYMEIRRIELVCARNLQMSLEYFTPSYTPRFARVWCVRRECYTPQEKNRAKSADGWLYVQKKLLVPLLLVILLVIIGS